MRISVVTPSFQQSRWLKLCVASVADQQVDVEHIIQDNCSDDGTLNWACSDTRVKLFVEKDAGMYDAINRGLGKATGDILAYLNCDEQYLPGALASVLRYFDSHPHIDVLFCDVVVIDENGHYICSRTVNVPDENFIRVGALPVFTCATFFRRRIITDFDLFFDPGWRAAGDADWVLRLMKTPAKMAVMRKFVSAFTDIGSNLGLGTHAKAEALKLYKSAPLWAQKLRFIPFFQHRLRRFFSGAYFPKPFAYAIFTHAQPGSRQTFTVDNPTFLWKSHLKASKGFSEN